MKQLLQNLKNGATEIAEVPAPGAAGRGQVLIQIGGQLPYFSPRLGDHQDPKVGVIGAGNYALSILLPELARTGARLAAVADLNGASAAHAARKFGAGKALTDYREILDDPTIQAVFVLVGHHLHSRFVTEALEAGKHVFVEKPLAITEAQLERVFKISTSCTLLCEG